MIFSGSEDAVPGRTAIDGVVVAVEHDFLSHEVDGNGIDALDFLDAAFHFSGAVCAVQILKSDYLFHNNVSFVTIFQSFSRRCSIAVL